MPRNVEIKARVHDIDTVRARAAALSDAPAVVLEQRREGQMLYRMSSHLLGGKAERVTALVDGMRKE